MSAPQIVGLIAVAVVVVVLVWIWRPYLRGRPEPQHEQRPDVWQGFPVAPLTRLDELPPTIAETGPAPKPHRHLRAVPDRPRVSGPWHEAEIPDGSTEAVEQIEAEGYTRVGKYEWQRTPPPVQRAGKLPPTWTEYLKERGRDPKRRP